MKEERKKKKNEFHFQTNSALVKEKRNFTLFQLMIYVNDVDEYVYAMKPPEHAL